MLRNILISLLLLVGLAARGTQYAFDHLTSNEGLPHNQVMALMCDSHGRIWIGTRNGLARYDGYSVKKFFHNPDNPGSISTNTVYSIVEDGDGRIWVGCADAVNLYDEKSDTFKPYDLQSARPQILLTTPEGKLLVAGRQLYSYDCEADSFITHRHPDTATAIGCSVDKAGRVYVGTNNSVVVYEPDLKSYRTLRAYPFDNYLTGRDGISDIFCDSRGVVWISLNGHGVECFYPTGNPMKGNVESADGSYEIYPAEMFPDGIVRAITEDNQGNIWLGTEKGIVILALADDPAADRNFKIKDIIQHDEAIANSLGDNAVYKIIVDPNDNVWVGTYFGGVDLYLNNRSQYEYFAANRTPDFPVRVVREMAYDGDGRLWIASEDAGLHIFDPATRRFTRVDNPHMGYNVHSLLYDPDSNEMWVGTFRHGLLRFNPRTLAAKHYSPGDGHNLNSDAVFSMSRLKDGTLLFGTTGGLHIYDRNDDKFTLVDADVVKNTFAYTTYVDYEDNIWVGTSVYGLFCITAENHELLRWNNQINPEISDNFITDIFRDASGMVWFGTSSGLYCIDYPGDKVTLFGEDTDLRISTVCSINEDPDKNLWVGTNMGLYKINPERNHIERFSTEQGLPYNQFNYASTIFGRDSLLYMGTVKGLVAFNPARLTNDNRQLEVLVNGLSINRPLDITERITLSHSEASSITIEYSAVAPGAADRVNYQIWLSGVDDGWRSMGKERRLVILNLSPGTHKLKIRASMDDNSWDDAPITTLEICVLPSPWLSWWAWTLYALLILAGIATVIKLLARRELLRKETLLKEKEQEHLNQVNREKFDFFTRVSHELKTPLSLIAAPLKQLSQASLDEASRRNVETAIKQADRMVGIVNELVTFNKMENGNFQFYLENGNAIQFSRQSAQQFLPMAAEKGISLYIDCEDNGETVWFSPLYVERIINNLLNNALKFTPSGGKVYFKASIFTSADSHAPMLRIEVRDTGIGILPSEIGKIFDLYYQTQRGHNFNHKGWGLGLFLIKRLVTIHKGTVDVQSEPGKGSTFVATVNVDGNAFDQKNKISIERRMISTDDYAFSPITVTPNAPSPQTERPDASPDDAPVSILIVEDDPDLLEFLSNFFSKNYTVYTATNGREGLETARSNSIDLVISDVMMPEMDGVTLCREIKQDLSLSHIPVVLLSAKSGSDEIVEGYQSGADSYVPKPFDPVILDLQVKNIIKTRRTQQAEIINSTTVADNEQMDASTLTDLDRDFILKINRLVDENLENSEFCVNDVINILGISRSLLYNKMRSLANCSIGDFIRKKRLSRSTTLLARGLTVAEVAYQVGFNDPNYFSKAFRREYGVSPSEYSSNKETKNTDKE